MFHETAHRDGFSQKRNDLLILRGLRVCSAALGASGICDVVEFHTDPAGVPLSGRKGLWRPFPVEYKRGKPKAHDADRLQLCAQALCLEEMLCCPVQEGALFYGETRRREPVVFDKPLRDQVLRTFADMHRLWRRGHTPMVKPSAACRGCSLSGVCLPDLIRRPDPAAYVDAHVREELP